MHAACSILQAPHHQLARKHCYQVKHNLMAVKGVPKLRSCAHWHLRQPPARDAQKCPPVVGRARRGDRAPPTGLQTRPASVGAARSDQCTLAELLHATSSASIPRRSPAPAQPHFRLVQVALASDWQLQLACDGGHFWSRQLLRDQGVFTSSWSQSKMVSMRCAMMSSVRLFWLPPSPRTARRIAS